MCEKMASLGTKDNNTITKQNLSGKLKKKNANYFWWPKLFHQKKKTLKQHRLNFSKRKKNNQIECYTFYDCCFPFDRTNSTNDEYKKKLWSEKKIWFLPFCSICQVNVYMRVSICVEKNRCSFGLRDEKDIQRKQINNKMTSKKNTTEK